MTLFHHSSGPSRKSHHFILTVNTLASLRTSLAALNPTFGGPPFKMITGLAGSTFTEMVRARSIGSFLRAAGVGWRVTSLMNGATP
jgi:hypothetical protein